MSPHCRTLNVVTAPTGAFYAEVLSLAARPASVFGFLTMLSTPQLSETAQSLLSSLEPYLLGTREAAQWPGTKILYPTKLPLLHIYRMTERSLRPLLDSAQGLYDWQNPALPEDLHFLRADGSTVVGSTAHEEDAWLELTPQELGVFLADVSADCLAGLSLEAE